MILYGPPGAGKDTITRTLQELDPRYVLYPRLKAGQGERTGYRMTTRSALDALRSQGEIVWENQRYDSVYAVDRESLAQRLEEHVPVLHLGQVEAIDAVVGATPRTRWLVVHLWCPRDVAAERIAARGHGDAAARLRAWDDTRSPARYDVAIDTAETTPDDAAQEIHGRMVKTFHTR